MMNTLRTVVFVLAATLVLTMQALARERLFDVPDGQR